MVLIWHRMYHRQHRATQPLFRLLWVFPIYFRKLSYTSHININILINVFLAKARAQVISTGWFHIFTGVRRVNDPSQLMAFFPFIEMSARWGPPQYFQLQKLHYPINSDHFIHIILRLLLKCFKWGTDVWKNESTKILNTVNMARPFVCLQQACFHSCKNTRDVIVSAPILIQNRWKYMQNFLRTLFECFRAIKKTQFNSF